MHRGITIPIWGRILLPSTHIFSFTLPFPSLLPPSLLPPSLLPSSLLPPSLSHSLPLSLFIIPFFSCLSVGQNTYQDGVNFLRDKFVRLNRNPGRKTVYTHVTCATDTNNIQFVFESVTDIIIAEHLRETGLF